MFKPLARPASGPFAVASTSNTSPPDIAAVKRVIELARAAARTRRSMRPSRAISDPVARKLAEWAYLRSYNTNPSFQRFADSSRQSGLAARADVPPPRRKRAVERQDRPRHGPDFFANREPTTAKGRFMLARALLAQGNDAKARDARAQRLARR